MTRLSLAVVGLLLAAHAARAGKVPLTPEQLREESALIVAGTVVSHMETTRDGGDGSRVRSVVLSVRIGSVEKGPAKPGDVVKAVCWVVDRGPRKGELWDPGHHGIPADGSSATFYLEPKAGDGWPVIYPNGIGKVSGPTLEFPFEPGGDAKADPTPAAEAPLERAIPGWAYAAGAAALGLVIVAVGYAARARAPTPRSPS